jgi:hypothetical protein
MIRKRLLEEMRLKKIKAQEEQEKQMGVQTDRHKKVPNITLEMIDK